MLEQTAAIYKFYDILKCHPTIVFITGSMSVSHK